MCYQLSIHVLIIVGQHYMYSGTSDSGPFEIGTLYNKPLYKGYCSRPQKLHTL